MTHLPKQERYKHHPTDTKDFIDRAYDMYPWEQFVGAMRWSIDKYFDRLGKKDHPIAEAVKIMDYAQRFHQKVVEECREPASADIEELAEKHRVSMLEQELMAVLDQNEELANALAKSEKRWEAYHFGGLAS
jgi:transaldolase